ncbi:hypothetical protein IC582_002483 [Cucumis melo]|uniref:RING-type E3 ubiquitin transferase n=2 Tax=Cucumis melo TaxID=3656 RepID=A0A1S3CF28_CUCME|nr:uncharacterized protein LOC103499761 isoform X1 [Cucumis melo]
MKSLVSLFFFVWGLQLFGELSFSFAQSDFEDVGFVEDRTDLTPNETPTYNYERFDEVQKQCKSVLSSAAELSSDTTRFIKMKEQLQFLNGDWWQDGGKCPLMPFENGTVFSEKRYYMYNGMDSTNAEIPLKLVSFWVTDIDPAHQTKKSVSVSGLLLMGITMDAAFDQWSSEHPHFQFWPGRSELTLPFQGIYTESKKNGGERVLCLLGSGMLPSRDQESDDPWSWAKDSNVKRHQMPLLQDDQVLLVLRYPMKYTLTSRVVQGEMKSLNLKSNSKYFDDIHISSQLGDANYDFTSEKVVKKACTPYPYNDDFMKKNITTYRGSSFCRVLHEMTSMQPFTILPNWRCNSTDEFCRKLGPFLSDKVINSTDGGFKDVRLYMQDVKCKLQGSSKNGISVSVSAVFRAVSPSENIYTARRRSALNNMTMVSEGLWKPSSGQLCMVGCVGLTNADKISCDSRICLYMPMSFSLKQRSILVGSISSMNDKPTYFPLSFENLLRPNELWSHFRESRPSYSYTKIALAGALLEKKEPFSFRSVIKKSLLRYPKLEDTETYELSASFLLEDLTLRVRAAPNPGLGSQASRTFVRIDMISVGSILGRDWSGLNSSYSDVEAPYHVMPESTQKQLLVNVSALLSISEQTDSNFSALFVEGIYDPPAGKMYLVGCRDVRSSWKVMFDSMDLEDGLDCQIEVIVSYPPTTAQWLINPTAQISISSQRTEDDPFYFSPIKIETMPIMYRRQRQDILSRKSVEGVLQILTLSLAIGCILSQIFYINHNMESVPFISLVTLGVQSLGYTLPLVTGAEALFKRRGSESNEESYDLENNLWFLAIDYIVKLQVVFSLLLTLRLCQKVWKSRIKLLRQAPLEPRRVPSDKWVLVATFFIHLIGYIAVLIVHTARTTGIRVKSYLIPSRASSSHMMQGWEKDLQEYVGLVQDFFLLPQVIGNLLWQIDCKPLRKFYFIGISLVRLLPHIYDFIRAPTVNPYFVEEYDFVNPSMDFYSRFGDVAIPLIAFILAVVVYIQQRWNYEKLSQKLIIGRIRLLPNASRMYQRLPSKSYEAELASAENSNTKDEDVD